ncbi:MAG: hypothetical protein K2J80_01520, partial [Oscillospiraceae bacterium]|nr:hypothetical protein [Oscillospiraceae bacterium]
LYILLKIQKPLAFPQNMVYNIFIVVTSRIDIQILIGVSIMNVLRISSKCLTDFYGIIAKKYKL